MIGFQFKPDAATLPACGLDSISLRSLECSLAVLREESMKRNLTLVVLVCGLFLTTLHAGTKQPYQLATVVSVANHENPPAYAGNPTDAPLQADVYSYDIGIQLKCTVYTVRYESGLNYLPSVFSPHQTVEVRLQKHVMNVNLPGASEVRLSIGNRSRVRDTSCAVDN
jgi:hypothetical protein